MTPYLVVAENRARRSGSARESFELNLRTTARRSRSASAQRRNFRSGNAIVPLGRGGRRPPAPRIVSVFGESWIAIWQ